MAGCVGMQNFGFINSQVFQYSSRNICRLATFLCIYSSRFLLNYQFGRSIGDWAPAPPVLIFDWLPLFPVSET